MQARIQFYLDLIIVNFLIHICSVHGHKDVAGIYIQGQYFVHSIYWYMYFDLLFRSYLLIINV